MPWRDASRAQPDSWYGVGRAQLERELDLVPPLGISLARFELPWALVAPKRPGVRRYDTSAARASDWSGYSWERTDVVVDACVQRGLRPLPQVVFSPPWAGGGEPNQPPEDPAHFGDFLRAAAERYQGSVDYWEIWNEPNLRRYWDGSMERYASGVLTSASRALHDLKPRPAVVLGGLAGGQGLPVVLAIAKDSFDIASFHYYPPRRFPFLRANVAGAVSRIREELQHGGSAGVPAWLTEVGAMARLAQPRDDMPVAGERGQLRLLRQAVRNSGADAVFWYTLRDHEIWSGSAVVKRVYWGLYDIELQPRAAARWLAELAQDLRAEIT
jgi:hypothetical protein